MVSWMGSPNKVEIGQIVKGSLLDMSFKIHEMNEMNVATLLHRPDMCQLCVLWDPYCLLKVPSFSDYSQEMCLIEYISKKDATKKVRLNVFKSGDVAASQQTYAILSLHFCTGCYWHKCSAKWWVYISARRFVSVVSLEIRGTRIYFSHEIKRSQ